MANVNIYGLETEGLFDRSEPEFHFFDDMNQNNPHEIIDFLCYGQNFLMEEVIDVLSS